MSSVGYFTVGEPARFLFTSCVKQTNERKIASELSEIHKRTALKDKHIFIFKGNSKRREAASQFESCTEMASLQNTLHLNYQTKMPKMQN